MTAAEFVHDPHGLPWSHPERPEGPPIEDDTAAWPWPTPGPHETVITILSTRPTCHGAWHYWTTGRVVIPRLPGLGDYVTVVNRPAGPMDAPAVVEPGRAAMVQYRFLDSRHGLARAMDPDRAGYAEPMFAGWPSSGPEAVWPPTFHPDDDRALRPTAR